MSVIKNVAKRITRKVLQRTPLGYRFLLRRDYGVSGPHGYPNAQWANAVLKSQDEVDAAIDQIRMLGLPIMDDAPKNWDSLVALDWILKTTNKNARVFDAGGELYSVILPWLSLYGYKNLIAGNLVFNSRIKKGPITYQYADITQTGFPSATFDAITCLSVIEHGVDLPTYFSEMSRILKPRGTLITSTDYYETAIDTRGQTAYGVPIRIFTRDEITRALEMAEEFSLIPVAPLDLSSGETVVHWEKYDLKFSFLIFSLQKAA